MASEQAPNRVGLCLDCRHMERITSVRGSLFYLCRRSATDSDFPKYPPLPVVWCAGYESRSRGRTDDSPDPQ